jgi:hypothetical protein
MNMIENAWSNEPRIISPRPGRTGIAMRSVAAAILLMVGFGCAAAAEKKPLTELLAACDQVAANPFDNTRPVGLPGVGFAKIVPETAISACEEAATAAPDDVRMAMQLGRAYMAAKDFDAARVQFIKAYQQGNAQAAANLAYLYEKGQGVPRDDARARTVWAFSFNKAVAVPRTMLKPPVCSSLLRIRATPRHKTTSVAFT